MYVNDRRRGRQIACKCVTSEVADTNSAQEAFAVIERRMNGSYDRILKAERNWGIFTEAFHQTNKKMQAAKADKNQQKPPVSPPAIVESNDLTAEEIAAIPAAT
jgi:hypothetical protein